MFDFYTADTHFGHENIIKHCNRYAVCQTAQEMDDMLVERWNSVVGPKDTIIHLGDVVFGSTDVLKRLNGKKYLILGNHDRKPQELNKYFSINPRDIIVDKERKLVMSHYPIYDWPHKFHGWLHVHGHSHGTKVYDPLAVDVGVDCWNFYPVTYEQIIEKIKTR